MGQNLIKSIESAVEAGDTSIDLSSKSISDLPSAVGKLGDTVERLALGNNYLSSLPDEMAELSKLRYLNIRGNHFKQFPTILYQCENLEILDISRNKLERLPDDIDNMKQLKNKIKELPTSIGLMADLKLLKLDDNPLVYPRREIWDYDDAMDPQVWIFNLKKNLLIDRKKKLRASRLRDTEESNAEPIDTLGITRAFGDQLRSTGKSRAFKPVYEAFINIEYAFSRLISICRLLDAYTSNSLLDDHDFSNEFTSLNSIIPKLVETTIKEQYDFDSTIQCVHSCKNLLNFIRAKSFILFNEIDVRIGKELTLQMYSVCVTIRDSCEILFSQLRLNSPTRPGGMIPELPARIKETIEMSEDALFQCFNAMSILEHEIAMHPTLKGREKTDLQQYMSMSRTSAENLQKTVETIKMSGNQSLFPKMRLEINIFLSKSTKFIHDFKAVNDQHQFGKAIVTSMQTFTRSVKNLAYLMKN